MEIILIIIAGLLYMAFQLRPANVQRVRAEREATKAEAEVKARESFKKEMDWRDANRETSKGGWIYVYYIPNQRFIKVGMTARQPEERMKEYQEEYGLVPDPASLKVFRVPGNVVTADIEDYVLLKLQQTEGIRKQGRRELFHTSEEYGLAAMLVELTVADAVKRKESGTFNLEVTRQVVEDRLAAKAVTEASQ